MFRTSTVPSAGSRKFAKTVSKSVSGLDSPVGSSKHTQALVTLSNVFLTDASRGREVAAGLTEGQVSGLLESSEGDWFRFLVVKERDIPMSRAIADTFAIRALSGCLEFNLLTCSPEDEDDCYEDYSNHLYAIAGLQTEDVLQPLLPLPVSAGEESKFALRVNEVLKVIQANERGIFVARIVGHARWDTYSPDSQQYGIDALLTAGGLSNNQKEVFYAVRKGLDTSEEVEAAVLSLL